MDMRHAALVALATSLLVGACKDDPLRVGGLCSGDADCPAGQVCRDGTCVATCTTDQQCIDSGAGVRCEGSGCVGLLRADPAVPAPVGEGVAVALDPAPVYLGEATLTFTWDQLAGPPVALSVGAGGVATFTSPAVVADTLLQLQVTITDGAETVTAPFDVTIENDVNEPPTAALKGPPGPVAAGQSVTLDAGDSSDPNPADTLSYAWEPLTLVTPGKGATATFKAPPVEQEQAFAVKVTVSDGADADTATLSITVTPEGTVCTPASCDDENPCTDDVCDPLVGCANTPITGPCDDGDACTDGDVCVGTVCTGDAISCDDEDPCTDDSCDPATGCAHEPGTAPCDDGDPCTVGDVCAGGACAGTPKDCGDGNPCTGDACEPGGACVHAWVENGTPCDDGDICTAGDFCDDGECIQEDVCHGSCCVANGSPGCVDHAVAACVCASDSYCCETTWDSQCAGEADACGACDGSCCEPGKGPGCAAEWVEVCVCQELGEAQCCDAEWDAACVKAAQKCGACSPGGAGCAAAPKGTEACNGCTCESCVCKQDPACCNTLWDASCAVACEKDCAADCTNTGGWGCTWTGLPGCAGCSCETCVCDKSPSCCKEAWTPDCAKLCAGTCGATCPPIVL